MKVNTNAPSHPGLNVDKSKATDTTPRTNESKEEKGRVTSSQPGSSVEISDNARMMKQANEIVSQTPDIRWDKVEELKQKIKAGAYHVDAAAVADKLIEEHLENNFGKNNL